MLKNFEELRNYTTNKSKKTVAVVCGHDGHTLEAVLKAQQENIINYILIGHKDDILKISKELGYDLDLNSIIDSNSDEDAASIAVDLINNNKADFLQKGLMQTATLLKAVVNKETGISLGRPMSHTALLEIPGYHKLLGVSDGGMIPNPDLEAKMAIVHNAVDLFHQLGYEKPLVSAICGAETVSPKIIETVDAAALKEAALNGEFGSCYLEGPISFDLAMDRHSSSIKGYDSEVCGETDILLVPNMTAGNMMVKALLLYADAKMTGVVTGAKCPIALNSRSASFEEKYNSLLLCAAICN